jgi:hypothetical protein
MSNFKLAKKLKKSELRRKRRIRKARRTNWKSSKHNSIRQDHRKEPQRKQGKT